MITRIIEIQNKFCKNTTEFANKIGVSQQSMSSYLNGKTENPSINIVVKILEAFPDISAEWLMRGEGQMLRGRHISVEPSEKEHVHVYEGFFEDEESSMVKENEADELKDMMAMFAKKFEKFVDHNFKPCD